MKNLLLSAAIASAFLSTAAKAETINCTEITSIPVIITAQGIYCLKHDLSSSLASGKMIDIQTNNVTIDLNGFKLGGLGAGTGTHATGISAHDRQNITIRNGSIRGFEVGIFLDGHTSSSGHLVEDVLLDTNREQAMLLSGAGIVIRNNRVVNTGAGGNFATAVGIEVLGNNIVVADNIISGISETDTAEGIFVSTGTLVEVRNNTIFDVKDATATFGIRITGTFGLNLIGNRILNTGGIAGITATGSAQVNCIGNTVAGFTTALSGCDFDSGNITP